MMVKKELTQYNLGYRQHTCICV